MEIIESIKTIRETTAGGIIIAVIFYFIIVVVAIKISDYILDKLARKNLGNSALHWKFLKPLLKVVIVILGLFGIVEAIPGFDNLGKALIASSSLVVAAIGLASQESIANTINGMFITIFKPFVVGDRVRLNNAGITGIVEDINLRHTIIRTFQNNRMIIPNTTINKEIIENFNYLETKVCHYLKITIRYGSDYKRALEIFKQTVREHPSFLDNRTDEDKAEGKEEVRVLVNNFRDIGVELQCAIWAQDMATSFGMCSDIRGSLMEQYAKEGIEIGQVYINLDNIR